MAEATSRTRTQPAAILAGVVAVNVRGQGTRAVSGTRSMALRTVAGGTFRGG